MARFFPPPFSRQGQRSQRSTPSNIQSAFMISSPPFCPNQYPRTERGGNTGGHIWAHILREVPLRLRIHRLSIPLVKGLLLRSIKIFFCLQFSFSSLFDFLVGLWLHVVDKAYMWYSHAYIAFCNFVLDIVDWETEWCCLCPATWYDYHTGILKAAYIFIVHMFSVEKIHCS